MYAVSKSYLQKKPFKKNLKGLITKQLCLFNPTLFFDEFRFYRLAIRVFDHDEIYAGLQCCNIKCVIDNPSFSCNLSSCRINFSTGKGRC